MHCPHYCCVSQLLNTTNPRMRVNRHQTKEKTAQRAINSDEKCGERENREQSDALVSLLRRRLLSVLKQLVAAAMKKRYVVYIYYYIIKCTLLLGRGVMDIHYMPQHMHIFSDSSKSLANYKAMYAVALRGSQSDSSSVSEQMASAGTALKQWP